MEVIRASSVNVCLCIITRRMNRNSSREDSDQSATYSDIEEDVYQESNDVRPAVANDLDSGEMAVVAMGRGRSCVVLFCFGAYMFKCL